ncbi:type II toxin-antitoxin system HicA family toxin [Helcobacillus massiliensis]|uniref:type II toxin-antitoxin system HicA family toxin n=1 Tax=Helcobacillus massiliensis TaxID=521392 RepID=UPI00160E41CE
MGRPIPYREVKRELVSRGWLRARVRGSHEQWVPPEGGKPLTIPRHREISAGVMRVIVRRLGGSVPRNWR